MESSAPSENSTSIPDQDQNKPRQRRPSSILPVGIAFRKNKAQTDLVPKVVLTPESPHSKLPKTLYDPNGNDNNDPGLSIFGRASTVTATCVDIDMESLSSSTSSDCSSTSSNLSLDEPVCSVARATWCQGNFRFLDEKGQSVASTAFTSMTMSSSSTTSVTSPQAGIMTSSTHPTTTNIVLSGPSLLQNPYRRIFEQRQAFYERFSQLGFPGDSLRTSDTSSIKSGWQRCQWNRMKNNNQLNSDIFTVRTNIEPFGPFVIEHDVKSSGPGKIFQAPNMICLNPEANDELRYATSHSGDGIESHLEVSLGKDGSVIKTRHQRLDQNSEENSILKLQYGEGGKVLEIQQTQSVTAVPLRSKHPHANSHHRPTSAYCTTGNSINLQQFMVPRYNSMPNLDGHRRRLMAASSDPGFNIYPADEEKRMAYTHGTFLSVLSF